MKKIGYVILPILLVLVPTVSVAYASFTGDEASCRNDGLYDGENNPFQQKTYEICGETYYDAFIEGCMSVEGNTRGDCESAADAGE
jgi:hypothetical protein